MEDNVKLRHLELRDAPFMLEWMHDIDVISNMRTDFASFAMSDCERFISDSNKDEQNIHLAIVDENDEYMGTVSLKKIRNCKAEFAITVRSCAMGKRFSEYGMEEMLRIGFEELGLVCIYWCVSPENKRALRFYDKHKYTRTDSAPDEATGYSDEQICEYIWYEALK